MKNTKMKKGFTLVELLFVMAIISILAGIGISQMSGSTDAALKVASKADVRTMIGLQSTYFINNQEYANSTTDLNFESSNEGINVTASGGTTGFCVDAGTADFGFKYESGTGKIEDGRCSSGPSIVMGF